MIHLQNLRRRYVKILVHGGLHVLSQQHSKLSILVGKLFVFVNELRPSDQNAAEIEEPLVQADGETMRIAAETYWYFWSA